MRRRARRCARTFAEEARQPNFPGLLVDFDHFSHDPGAADDGGGLDRRRWSRAATGFTRRCAGRDLGHAGADGRPLPAGVAGVESRRLRCVDRAGGPDGREAAASASAPARPRWR